MCLSIETPGTQLNRRFIFDVLLIAYHTKWENRLILPHHDQLTLKVLVATIDAQWEGMGDVGSVRYEPALLPPYPTIRGLSYSN